MRLQTEKVFVKMQYFIVHTICRLDHHDIFLPTQQQYFFIF